MPYTAPNDPAPKAVRRLGLYGGSFDPIHRGHLMVAVAAMEELGLDRLVFLPAARSPFKPGTVPAPADRRAAWIRQALAGQTRMDVDLFEIQKGGVSYTVDTVREFRRRHPSAELHWLIGADHVPLLHEWRESAELAVSATFVVIPRPGEVRADREAPWRLRHLKGWPFGVSSSEIRERVRRGLPIDHLVPAGVAESVHESGCYRDTDVP